MKKIYKTNSLSLTKIALVSILFFIASAISDAANATVKKCVPLVGGNQTTQTTCTSNPNSYAKHIDWAAECTTSRTNPGGSPMKSIISEIKGIAACSNQDGGAFAATSGTIATSDNANDNGFCWCKMTTPAVSLWVFNSVFGDTGDCVRNCAVDCAKGVQAAADFRSALFSGMGE